MNYNPTTNAEILKVSQNIRYKKCEGAEGVASGVG
jgi:hypothetical protein